MGWNQRLIDVLSDDIGNIDALLTIVSSFEKPCTVREIKQRGLDAGFRRVSTLNIYRDLARVSRYVVLTGSGYVMTTLGRAYLRERGLDVNCEPESNPVKSLRAASDALSDVQTQTFVREAVSCHEHGFYRAAVIMSWIGAMSMLQRHTVECHLDDFNAVACQKGRNWRQAKTFDDLSRIRESEFLDRLSDISVISSDVKKELRECLGRRNSCSHPNSFVTAEQTSAHHVEVLINNVFARVCSLCQ